MSEWVGRTIGKVRIDKLLAKGGMAQVFLGTHLTLDRPVAVKILHSYMEEDEGLRERLQQEAKVVAGLRHPNIVQIYDFDTIDGHPYIVMEYLVGPTLASYLQKLHNINQKIPLYEVARLFGGLADALDNAHGLEIIHRDIKPSNIILRGKTDDIPTQEPFTKDVSGVLTDFGLVKIGHSTHQTTIGTISGTPNYMSPEQALGTKTDSRTDIYSLGVVLYEMLAGRVPFEGDNTMTVIYKHINEPPPVLPEISSELQAVLNQALAKKPDDRYQSCHEMARDLNLAIYNNDEGRGKTIHGNYSHLLKKAPSSTSQKPRKSLKLIIASLIAVLALVFIGTGAFLIYPKLSASPTQTVAPSVTSQAVSSLPTETVQPKITPTDTAGVDLVSAPATETTVLPSGEGMVKIISGTYEVGLNPSDEFHSGPMALSLGDFWIDIFQTTNAQYQQFIEETGAQPPSIWPGVANHPVRGVTWEQANAYCMWMNKRLATEAEWEATGRGPGQNPQLYPWGNDPTDGGNVLQMPDQDTYEIGSLPFNVSHFGVYDMVGNVWEWVGEAYNNLTEGYKILRGGRFGIPQDLAYRLTIAPSDHRYDQYAGFRCAADQIKP
jgi:serine/threonine protein kinase